MLIRRWTIPMMLWSLAMSPAALLALDADEDADADKSAVSDDDSKSGKDAKKKKDPVKKLAIMTLDHNVVPARMLNIPLPGKTKALREVIEKLDHWGGDDEIGAVLFNITDMQLSLPDIEELRQCIVRLQGKGKKVFAYFHSGAPANYLLACAADEICVAPHGSVFLPGLGWIFPFMQGHYQMLGLEFDVITAGAYKYGGFITRREPNKYFEEEFGAVLDSWFDSYVGMVAEGRDLDRDTVVEIINHGVFNAQEAQQRGLVDHLAYFDEYRDRVLRRERMKKYKDYDTDWSEINSIQDMLNMMSREWQKEKERREAVGPKIAVLHARGPIIDINLGPAYASMVICRDDFIETIEEIRRNKSIKGVVLRVDSPGGSGYASDAIWRKLIELNEEKPLVVSMGRVAGSGGYYIAVPGQLIFAQPTTITGSIGVLGIFQSAWSALNRADYNLLFMKRGDRALLGSGVRPLSKEDRELIQQYILDFYEVFVDRVARGRKMPRERVKEIAGGRIYTGEDALKNGLIDRLGGLKDAIEAVREIANIPPSAKLRLVHYPRLSSLGEFFAGALGGASTGAGINADSAIGTAIELIRRANSPAQMPSFESQLMLFSTSMRPLCWMPVPDLHAAWYPGAATDGTLAGWSEPSPERVRSMLFSK